MDSFSNFIEFAARFAITYFIISMLFNMIDGYFASRIEVGDRVREKLNQLVHRVECEKHQDTYYWFDLDSKQFLAQGRDLEEIKSTLRARFADHIFVLNENQMLVGPDFDPVEISAKNMPRIEI